VLLRMRLSGRDTDTITTLVATASEPYAHEWDDADVRRYMGCVPAELLDDLLRLRAARAAAAASAGTLAGPEAVALEAELAERVAGQRTADSPLTLADLAIDGRDLRETLGIPEGPVIGDILGRLLADVIEEPSLNARLTLLTRASLVLERLMQQERDPGGPADSPIR
jgi:tRNA nucleotidyltransferase (CCA-adding enzyme)